MPALDTLLKDPDLAPEGLRKIDFAASRMPVLSAVTAELARTRPLAGHRIAACLHVTTETANLCRALVAGGAELALCASNPLSTKDDVAAAIHQELGAAVFAVHGADRDTFYRQVAGVLASRPTLVVDDGADLTATIHTGRRDLLGGVAGATEVTSTGVLRARNMAREGALAYPLLAVNDAATKHLFDNRYGTGQSTLDGILRATNVLLAGKVLVVVGYGWCGRGVATRARGMGARVVVCEVDPLKALEAVMEGYQVLPVAEAARVGEVFVTVTGNRDALTVEHLAPCGRAPSWPTPATSTWRWTWPGCAGWPPRPPRSAPGRWPTTSPAGVGWWCWPRGAWSARPAPRRTRPRSWT